MTQDEIIRMAREAGLDGYGTPLGGIERFAALVAAHEREKLITETGYLGEQLQAYILAEREACAKVCAEGWKEGIGAKHQGDVFAVAIRARGENGTA